MLSNMACSLIEHKRISTTVAKAKALKGYVEPLLTKSKTDSTHSRRQVFRYLKNKYAVTELFREVAPKIADRQGGYTRIIRTGNRLGDNAEMCIIELVDFNALYGQDTAKKTTRRSRRGGKGKSSDTLDATTETVVKETKEKTAETKEEEPEAKAEAAMEEVAETEVPEAKTEDVPEVEAKADDETAEEEKSDEASEEEEKE